jgi:hypothetical protein
MKGKNTKSLTTKDTKFTKKTQLFSLNQKILSRYSLAVLGGLGVLGGENLPYDLPLL